MIASSNVTHLDIREDPHPVRNALYPYCVQGFLCGTLIIWQAGNPLITPSRISQLKGFYKVIEELIGKDNACLSYSVLDVQEGIYSAIYHDRSANRIQHLRNSLQGTLAKAVLDTEHIGKKHYARVENTLAPLAAINKEISAK